MAHLTEAQLKTIRQLLAEREADLREQVREARAALAEQPSAQGRQVEDMVEEGEQRFRTGIEHVEMQRDLRELEEIEQAVARIADGSCGECVACGRPIAVKRLMAQPSATRCVACQTVYEKTHPTPRYTV